MELMTLNTIFSAVLFETQLTTGIPCRFKVNLLSGDIDCIGAIRSNPKNEAYMSSSFGNLIKSLGTLSHKRLKVLSNFKSTIKSVFFSTKEKIVKTQKNKKKKKKIIKDMLTIGCRVKLTVFIWAF